MCSFKTPVEGSYYGPIISRLYKNKQIIQDLAPDTALPVHTAWDLGMDDSTSIWFFQQFKSEIRLVYYYENSGEGFPFYARELQRWAVQKGITYGRHYAPHDIKVRELGTGKSRLEVARSLGLKFTPVRKLPVQDGIEAVRNLLPRCWFGRSGCTLGLEHLKGYHKEWDSSKQVYRKTPVHDSSSHGADAFRTLAMGMKENKQGYGKHKQRDTSYKVQPVSW